VAVEAFGSDCQAYSAASFREKLKRNEIDNLLAERSLSKHISARTMIKIYIFLFRCPGFAYGRERAFDDSVKYECCQRGIKISSPHAQEARDSITEGCCEAMYSLMQQVERSTRFFPPATTLIARRMTLALQEAKV
jgi:hypothetical protein